MNYLSIDIETTGLDRDGDQILEFCAIADDWVTPVDNLPIFERIIKQDRVHGNPFALSMHADLLREISKSKVGWNVSGRRNFGCCKADELLYQLAQWVREDTRGHFSMDLKVAGHNAGGFDVPFVKRLPGYGEVIEFHHRVLDVGSLYFEPTDHELPATQKCLTRAGFGKGNAMLHRAYPDALNAVRLIRAHYKSVKGAQTCRT